MRGQEIIKKLVLTRDQAELNNMELTFTHRDTCIDSDKEDIGVYDIRR